MYLVTRQKTIEMIKRHHLVLRERFGQNFIVDKNTVDFIINASDIKKEDVVLEIGPGIGNMTELLSEVSQRVIAVEIDRDLVQIMKEDSLKACQNVEIIGGDFLKLDLQSLLKTVNQKIKVISNIPYYITTPILFRLLEHREKIDTITLMIQKEVAERLVARESTKDYGALTIIINTLADPEYVTTVSRQHFLPEPNVDSAVLKLKILNNPRVEVNDLDLYFRLVKLAFGQRRKTLVNALQNQTQIFRDKKEIVDILEEIGLGPKVRGEELTIKQFEALTKGIESRGRV